MEGSGKTERSRKGKLVPLSFSLVLCSLGQSFVLAFRGECPAKEKETSKEPYQRSKNKAIVLVLFLIYGRIFIGKTKPYPIWELYRNVPGLEQVKLNHYDVWLHTNKNDSHLSLLFLKKICYNKNDTMEVNGADS